ncbi:hypothetical protein BJ138DRAFT_1118960 [Hygrophoropsis aurantiaca]|uniref:Uncharacterized protein n=1 Tax=Hygrophoropsis aurantiaca TaxID=72124 RepID=A0ACB7ZVZ5_9AGAM|nr:hypothetical protein BJ138DRAFT_1118960 [Hygrophoropsis aurantiaca]
MSVVPVTTPKSLSGGASTRTLVTPKKEESVSGGTSIRTLVTPKKEVPAKGKQRMQSHSRITIYDDHNGYSDKSPDTDLGLTDADPGLTLFAPHTPSLRTPASTSSSTLSLSTISSPLSLASENPFTPTLAHSPVTILRSFGPCTEAALEELGYSDTVHATCLALSQEFLLKRWARMLATRVPNMCERDTGTIGHAMQEDRWTHAEWGNPSDLKGGAPPLERLAQAVANEECKFVRITKAEVKDRACRIKNGEVLTPPHEPATVLETLTQHVPGQGHEISTSPQLPLSLDSHLWTIRPHSESPGDFGPPADDFPPTDDLSSCEATPDQASTRITDDLVDPALRATSTASTTSASPTPTPAPTATVQPLVSTSPSVTTMPPPKTNAAPPQAALASPTPVSAAPGPPTSPTLDTTATPTSTPPAATASPVSVPPTAPVSAVPATAPVSSPPAGPMSAPPATSSPLGTASESSPSAAHNVCDTEEPSRRSKRVRTMTEKGAELARAGKHARKTV